MKLKEILLSYDTFVSLTITLIVCYFLPTHVMASFCNSVYYIGITVLAIVFSLFFASMAIIMSTPDNKFIKFLEEDNLYTDLMKTFKFTLLMLFIGLGYSIFMYAYSSYLTTHINIKETQNKIWFLLFVLIFTYSLMATALSISDSIMFSKYRIDFLKQEEEEEKQKKLSRKPT